MRKVFRLFAFIAASFSAPLLADDHCNEPQVMQDCCDQPWLTGPLITPGATTFEGKLNLQPYLYVTRNYGQYDSSWKAVNSSKSTCVSINSTIQTKVTEWMDITVVPQINIVSAQGISTTRFADLPLTIGLQIYRADIDEPTPNIEFTITEIFPTGQYQNLNPGKNGIDASGAGSFTTSFSLRFQKIWAFDCCRFFDLRLAFAWQASAPVHVKGYNAYGGGIGTSGKIYPGNSFATYLGMEYAFTRNWAFAFDLVATTGNSSRFKGDPGVNDDGSAASPIGNGSSNFMPLIIPGGAATVGGRSYASISVAPALEYNFSSNLGLIAGGWFSVAGRNRPQFASGIISLDWSF